jgi:hypothetical protein
VTDSMKIDASRHASGSSAVVFATLGQRDSMYVMFERAIDAKDPDAIWFLNAIPSLRPMRQEPRYQRLLERMGLPKEWRR